MHLSFYPLLRLFDKISFIFVGRRRSAGMLTLSVSASHGTRGSHVVHHALSGAEWAGSISALCSLQCTIFAVSLLNAAISTGQCHGPLFLYRLKPSISIISAPFCDLLTVSLFVSPFVLCSPPRMAAVFEVPFHAILSMAMD